MAYNYRYPETKGEGPSGLDMTDIPGILSKPTNVRERSMEKTRSNSPPKIRSGMNAEMLSSDVVKNNEDKVRSQIKYINNLGVSGPYLNVDQTTPAPKYPKLDPGVSSYKMHFSPGRSRERLPVKLNQSASTTISSFPQSVGLRHMANGDAMYRRSHLSSSIDLGKSGKPVVKYAQNLSMAKKSDDFRFKKNLTTNADRILGKNNSYASSSKDGKSSKYEDFKREALHVRNQSDDMRHSKGINHYKTVDNSVHQENYNSNNVSRGHISKPSIEEPAGTYNSSSLKRSMGIDPKDSVNFVPTVGGSPRQSSHKIGEQVSVPNFNDLSYHRKRNIGTYGFNF